MTLDRGTVVLVELDPTVGPEQRGVRPCVAVSDPTVKQSVESMMTNVGIRLVLLIAIGATIGCDRVTKQIATTTLAGAPSQSFLGDTFRLEYTENTGAFLGLGADWPLPIRTALFTVGNGLLLLVMAVMAMRLHWPRLAVLGLALLVAGGVSNLFDRILYGQVIDFMNVGLGPVRTGIFNVADMAIMLGAGLVVFASYRSDLDRGERGSSA